MNRILIDSKYITDLRDVFNTTDIFFKDEQERYEKFDFMCAIMDRFDSTVTYINNNLNVPKSEMNFITYIAYCCIIKDGIKCLFKKLNLTEKKDNNFFKEIYADEPLNILDDNYTDDDFFDYFRSLVFAHPFLTNRSIPNKISSDETQYSPYTLINKRGILRKNDTVGVKVYSNKRESFSITFSFEILQKYIKWKYNMLVDIKNELINIIQSKEEGWKKHKVNRELSNSEILLDIKNIMEERYIDSLIVENLINYFNCESTNKSNNNYIKKYKDEIIKIIPDLCNYIDNYDHENAYRVIAGITEVRPKNKHEMLHYQLEKIYCYLNDDSGHSNIDWGLKQAEAFSKEFAKKWVTIEPYKMSLNEIKMLTNVACYLEYKEENENI